MNKTTEEHIFDPESMEVPTEEDDLGDYEFEVDKLEAEAEAEETPEETTEDEADEIVAEEDTADEEDTKPEDEVEETEDDEPEASAEEEPAVEDSLADPEENPMIPRERLNQANRKRQEEAARADEALAKVADLEAQMTSAAEDAGIEGIDPASIKEAAEKVLDGDTEAFSQVMADQFNKMQKATSKSEADILERATQNAIQAIEQNTRDMERQDAADEWIAVYPELDHESEGVNTEALEEAIDIAGMYEQRGYRPGAAMERAVRTVAANFDLKSTEKVATLKTPAAKPAARKKVTRKVEQPAATGQGGAEKTATPTQDATSMSQDEWDALPDSVRDEILTGTG